MKSIHDRPVLRTTITEYLREEYIALLGQNRAGLQAFVETLVKERSQISGMKFVTLSLPDSVKKDDDFKEFLLERLISCIAYVPPEKTLQDELKREREKWRLYTADYQLGRAFDLLGERTTADPLVIILQSLGTAPEIPLRSLLTMLRNYHNQINMPGEPGKRLRFLAVGDLRLWTLCCNKFSDGISPFNIAKRVFLDGLSHEDLLAFDQFRNPEIAMLIRSLTGGVPSLVEKVLELSEIPEDLSVFFERLDDEWNALPEASKQALTRMAQGDENAPSHFPDNQCPQIPWIESPWKEAFWKGFLSVQDHMLTWYSPIHHTFVLSRVQGRGDISKSTLMKVDLLERAVRIKITEAQSSLTNLLINATPQETRRSKGDFDVFLCYHGIDNVFVKHIGERLKEQGLRPWLDEWELRPGLPWQRLLEDQMANIKTVAVFVGANGIGPWQHLEIDAFLREFVRRKCPVIPVILADASEEPSLPPFLAGMTWVDFRKQEPEPLARLIWGITGTRDFT